MVHTLLGYVLLPLALWLGIASAWAADPSDVLARALLGTAHDWPFPGQWKSYDVYAYDTLKNHDFQRPYQNALNQLPAAVKQTDGPWLAPMKMTSTLNRFLRTPQGEFVYVSGCKPHDCGNRASTTFVLLSEAAISAARGTGIGIRVRRAISRATSTCLC